MILNECDGLINHRAAMCKWRGNTRCTSNTATLDGRPTKSTLYTWRKKINGNRFNCIYTMRDAIFTARSMQATW